MVKVLNNFETKERCFEMLQHQSFGSTFGNPVLPYVRAKNLSDQF